MTTSADTDSSRDCPVDASESDSSAPTLRRRLAGLLTAFVLLLAGVAMMAYPVVASAINDHRLAQRSHQITESFQGYSPQQLQRERDQAEDFHREHQASETVEDPWSTTNTTDNPANAVQDAWGSVEVPRVGISLPLFSGTSQEVLAHGAGHMPSTNLPVGGAGTHAGIAAHTAFVGASMFDNLQEVEIGDRFEISAWDQNLHYEVESVDMVLPHRMDMLDPQADRDLVTLITCAPYGKNTHRLLVRGHRIEAPSTEQPQIMPARDEQPQNMPERSQSLSERVRSPVDGVYLSTRELWLLVAAGVALVAICLWFGWALRRELSRHARRQ